MTPELAEALVPLKASIHERPQTGIILGSGLSPLAAMLADPVRIPFEKIPHFPVSSVTGHVGELFSGRLGGSPLLIQAGRVHYYEGYPLEKVVFPVRILAGLGVKRIIITNAAGAVNTDFNPEDIAVISDHINLMGDTPLRGANAFVDLGDAYSSRLRALAHKTAAALNMTLREGVYAAFSGPSYETPAEIRLLQRIGADMVGMSTVPEVIAARHLGLEVLGLSMISNMAAGLSQNRLSHQEVIECARNAAQKLEALIIGILERIDS